ncbi:MAG: peptide deformylase [Candidatus Peribacteraceae bacterium]
MPILPIVTGEKTPILRAKTKKVAKVTKEIEALIADMYLTVENAKGAGIAAPQVGHSERVCIASIGGMLMPLINPAISWYGEEKDSMEEGCLSLPGIWLMITRPTEIIVKFETTKGKKLELKLQGYDARVVQHEVDHLDGVLMVDRANEQKEQ